MEVVYPQLWIFNFDRSDWTCVEAAGGKGGGGAGGKTKGSQAASGTAGGSGNGGAAAGPGPPGVFDHTATLAGGKHIVVIGGIMVGRALNSEAREVLQCTAFVFFEMSPSSCYLRSPSGSEAGVRIFSFNFIHPPFVLAVDTKTKTQ